MGGKCYLICGDDEFLVEQSARQIVDRIVPASERALGLETIDGRADNADECLAAIRRCIESVETVGFLSGAKLTWLREPTFLAGGRSGDAAVVKERLADLTALVKRGLADGQTLLVTTTRINRGSAIFKAFQASGEVQDFGGGAKRHQLEKMAAQHVVDLLPHVGLQMEPRVRDQFLARVGSDTRLLANELQKLRTYLGRDGAATAEDVQAVVSVGHEAEVWDLLDAVAERNAPQMVANLRRLFDQADSLIGLVTMLEGRIRDLLIVREALDKGWVTAAGGGGYGSPKLTWKPVPPEIEAWFTSGDGDFRTQNAWKLGKTAGQAGHWTLRELRWARHLLIELREALVSSPLPAELLVETALLRVLGRPRTGRAAPATTKG